MFIRNTNFVLSGIENSVSHLKTEMPCFLKGFFTGKYPSSAQKRFIYAKHERIKLKVKLNFAVKSQTMGKKVFKEIFMLIKIEFYIFAWLGSA